MQEALSIVRLIQDNAWWTGESLYIKFMDVQKFFDTMNYRKALIDAHLSGLHGKNWKIYESINKFKTCIPSTPLGPCSEIIMDEVFVQGSADAVLMAWNTMDARNKREEDRYDPEFVIEGILVNGVIFVDDIVVFARTEQEVIELLVSDEVFQRSNRLRFKTTKCKIILINAGDGAFEGTFKLNGETVEVVLMYKYLGTIVEQHGRKLDVEGRIKKAHGVVNEIGQLWNKFN